MKTGFKPWPLLLLAGLTVLSYGNSLHGRFVFDDQEVIFQPAVINARSLSGIVSITTGWRQLLFATYAFNNYWSGFDPFSYHVVNLLLHVVNVLLVYGIILVLLRRHRLERAPEAALAGALIFGVHPLLSSAVSYVAGRSSVLCATFYFLAVLLFLKGLETNQRRPRVVYFVFMGLAGFLAWQAKQEAITLPLLLASILFLQTEKTNWRWIGGLAAIPLAFAILIREQLAGLFGAISSNQELISAGFEPLLAFPVYFRTYLVALVGYYFPRFAVPLGLSADPHILPVEHWYSLEFLFAVPVLAGLVWLTLHFRKTEPLFSLGMAAMLVSPLTAYAVVPLPDVVLEHRAYIPALGMALLAAWLFQLLTRSYLKVRWIVLAAAAATLMSMTATRNNVWATNIALWEDAVAKGPAKPRSHFNLAQAYQDAGRWPDAIQQYLRALELKPDIYAAYSNMSAILLDQGQFDKARDMLLKVTSLSPRFTEGYINLGVMYVRLKQPDKALEALNKALEISPDNFGAIFNKAEALSMKGELQAALEGYKRTVQLRPDIPRFRMSLGLEYWRLGDRAAAEMEFLQLIDSPLAAEAYRNMGVMNSQAGQPDRAIEYLRRAVSLQNLYPEAHHDLGVAYIQKQMTDDAIEQFKTTLTQRPDHGAAALNLAVAYQNKGDLQSARQTLEKYIEQYANTNSPYITQARLRLGSLK